MDLDSFTQPAQEAISRAIAEARRYGQSMVMPEHIFLGICLSDSPWASAMYSSGLDPVLLQEIVPQGMTTDDDTELPFSDTAELLGDYGRAASGRVDPGALLTGLARLVEEEQDPRVAAILSRCEISTQQLRACAAQGSQVPADAVTLTAPLESIQAGAQTKERRFTGRRRRWENQLREEARHVLRTADAESRALGHDHICDAHLFFALSQGDSTAAETLNEVGLTPESISVVLKESHPPAQGQIPSPLPVTDEARKALETVSDRSTSAGQGSWNCIGLLAVLLEQGDTVKEILAAHGIDSHIIYKHMDKYLGMNQEKKKPVAPVQPETAKPLTLEERVEELEHKVSEMEDGLDMLSRRGDLS